MIGVPVVFLPPTADPFNLPKLVALTIGVACALAIRVVEALHGRPWKDPRALAVPAALLAIPLALAWALSPYRGWALLGLHARFQGLIPYLVVIVFGGLVAEAFRGRVRELALAVVWAGAIMGGYSVVQAIGADPFNWSLYGAPTEAVSTTGNPNFTGGFLGIVLPLSLGLMLTDPDRRRLITRLLALIVVGWLVARSQGGWAAGVAGSALVAGYWLQPRFRFARVVAWALVLLVALVTAGAVIVAMIRPDSRFTIGAAAVRARWSQAAFDMGREHLIVGRGPNSFAIEGVRHRPLEDALSFNFDFPDDPHSVPMSMFANLGLPGLIGFIAVLAWALWFFFRSGNPSLLQVASMGAIVAYFIQSIVSIDEITLRLGLWVGLAGLFGTSVPDEIGSPARKAGSKKGNRRAPGRQSLPSSRPPLGVVVTAIVATACIVWALSLLAADIFVRQGSTRFSAGDVEGGRAAYATALSLRESAEYRGRLALALRRFAVEEGSGPDESPRVNEEIVARAEHAFAFTEEIPYVFSIASHARLLEEVARARDVYDPEAAALYRRAIDLDPRNMVLRVELAKVLLRGEEAELALDVLSEVRPLIGQRLPAYWGALALTAAEAEEEELAREAMEVALALDPAEPSALEAREILDG